MVQAPSIVDRLRSWAGFDEVDPNDVAFLQKLERAEEDVALVRLLVVVVNGVAFLWTSAQGGPTRWPAVGVLLGAFLYGTVVVLLEARPSFGKPAWSLSTVGADAFFISAWLAATGGFASPYFPLWYASIAAVGYRYNLQATMGVSLAYAGAYAAVCGLTGGIGSGVAFALRIAYIPITGSLVGMASEGYVAEQNRYRNAKRKLVDAIQTLDRRFAALLDGAPDRFVVTDPDGNVEYANGSTESLGFRSYEGEPTQAVGMHHAAIRSAVDTGDRIEYLASPDETGSDAPFWCRVAPIVDDGRVAGTVLTARLAPEEIDLTQQGRRDRPESLTDGQDASRGSP